MKAVFLDRDGVLSVPEFRDGRSYAPRHFEDFHLYPGAAEAVEALKAAGFIVVVVTNQPDVGAGFVPQETVESMHAHLRREIAVDDIEVCYETRQTGSSRRKPEPGMLLDAAERWNLSLKACYMVGDREGDVIAGHKAGCTTIFIDLGYSGEQRPKEQAATVGSLAEAVEWILSEERRRSV